MFDSPGGDTVKKVISDGYLNHWFRKAVLASFHYRCGICGLSWKAGALEAHHIIKRRRKFTRWDFRNGIPLCKECHALAHTKKGELFISRRHPYYADLVNMECINFKDYLVAIGMTENEFRQRTLKELKEKVGELIEV